MPGYTGKILNVNLSTGEFQEERIPERVYKLLLAGVGLGAYLLYQRIPAGADPLGPENVLGFVSGLLTGTGSVITGRWMVVCKSPLTGGWGDANCGGNFSPAIKQCGYDGIFFSGIAKEPVYLYIDAKGPQLKPAGHLWGLDAVAAEERLVAEQRLIAEQEPAAKQELAAKQGLAAKQELAAKHRRRKDPCVAVIGPAAEKLSLIAGICNEGGRIAARSGVGAVMGSKRLKAVVLAGVRPIPCHDPAAVKAISKELSAKVRRQNLPAFLPDGALTLMGRMNATMKKAAPLDGIISAGILKRWGTIMNNTMGAVSGDSPIKNWGGSVKDYGFRAYRQIAPDRIIRRETEKYHCYSCILGCGGRVSLKDLDGQPGHSHKPEYETCCAFGGLVLNQDMEAIYIINELLNRAGMDSISAGATVAFAIECYQNGLLTKEMTGGLELKWGDSAAITELVKKMIAREGIGDLLADGVKMAAARLGEAAKGYAVHAGGQEPGMHDSRMDPQLGIHFSADPTPGRHTIGSAQYYDVTHLWEKVSWAPATGAYVKAEEYLPSEMVALKTVANSCYKELADGAGGCLFGMVLGVEHWRLFDWLNAATGWNKTPDEYMEVGRRIQTLRQMFNIKHGIAPRQFRLHPRMAGEPPLAEGPLKGRTLAIDAMLKLHWKAFGWDENSGAPLEETIQRLELDELTKGGA